MPDIQQWAKKAAQFRLPAWEELPPLELYMDQVNIMLNRYIHGISAQEQPVTSAMINNYVKMGVVPRPEKKKYSRMHLAALIIVCSLKNTHAIATIRAMLPEVMDESSMETVYRAYVAAHGAAVTRFVEGLRAEEAPEQVVVRAAVEAELARSLVAYMGAESEEEKA